MCGPSPYTDRNAGRYHRSVSLLETRALGAGSTDCESSVQGQSLANNKRRVVGA